MTRFHPNRPFAVLAMPLSCGFLALGLAGPGAAQVTNHPDDVIITGNLTVDNGTDGDLYVEDTSTLDGRVCVGNTCNGTETYTNDVSMLFKFTQHSIVFDDTSSSTLPDRDWTIRVNDPNSPGLEKFAIEDVTQGTTPFTIEVTGQDDESMDWVVTTTPEGAPPTTYVIAPDSHYFVKMTLQPQIGVVLDFVPES